MLNSNQYNQNTYNWQQNFISTVSGDDVIFNGLGLLNENICITKINNVNLPDIKLDIFENPIVDGGGVINRRFTDKMYEIEGTLKADTETDLNILIDLFKQKITGIEGFLDIKYNGYYRRTRATCKSSNIFDKKHYNNTFVPFKITLQSVEPFSWTLDVESRTFSAISGTSSETIEYYGTASSRPKVIVQFTNPTSKFILNMNSRQLTIEQTINATDILYLDSEAMTVSLNGVEINYKGSFPFLYNGANTMSFTSVGSISIDVTVNFNTFFL